MKTRCLVTGAQGFVGRYLVSRLLAESDARVVLGIGRSPELPETFTHPIRISNKPVPASLPEGLKNIFRSGRYEYRQADVRDREGIVQILDEFCPDVLFHLASGLRDDPADYLFRTNVEGTIKLLEAIGESRVKIRMVILGSSGGVYGAPEDNALPITEEARCRPVDVYSASKLAAEHVTRILAGTLALPVVVCRIFNLVGPGQDERHVCGRFASWLSGISRMELPPVIEAGSLGTTRDFLDVRDAAKGLEKIMEYGTAGTVYNLGSGGETRIGDVLRILISLAGMESVVRVESVPGRREDIPRHFADITRLRSLGFHSDHSLRESLKDLLEYYSRVAEKLSWT